MIFKKKMKKANPKTVEAFENLMKQVIEPEIDPETSKLLRIKAKLNNKYGDPMSYVHK